MEGNQATRQLSMEEKRILQKIGFQHQVQTWHEDQTGGGSENEASESDNEDNSQNHGNKRKKDDKVGPSKKRAKTDSFPEEIAYSDSNVEIGLKQVMHKKQTQYSIDDHLFELKVKQKEAEGTPPLLISLAEGIKESIVFMLDKLKEQYDGSQHRQVYITVCESNILKGQV
jgi:hypothetical protein